jgi:hypothetical protein
VRQGNATVKDEVGSMDFEDGRGHEQRNASTL